MRENPPPQTPSENAPDQAEQQELLRFADELKAARPQLSEAALNNVAAVMRREMAARQRPVISRFGLAVAAAVLLAIGAAVISALLLSPATPQRADLPRETEDTRRDLERGRELMERFASESNFQGKLALLPEMAQYCSDEQLSPEARYLVALHLLRPHLTWHELYRTVSSYVLEMNAEDVLQHPHNERWTEAHGGDAWMISESERQTARDEAQRRSEKQGLLQEAQKAPPNLFWRLRDPKHAEVARAVALLGGVQTGEWAAKARQWALDLARNNTVITFDVSANYRPGEPAPVVVDTRCAETLSLKLYRVRKPDVLVSVCGRIGNDFLFRDYGLSDGRRTMDMVQKLACLQDAKMDRARLEERRGGQPMPPLDARDLVQSWKAQVSELDVLETYRRGYWEDEDEDEEDEEARYFGDGCEAYRDRLDKSYDKSASRSSWRYNRILNVPAKALAQDGAYILVAEANGQMACAPILVRPLSLTLRRCRDGVFVLVSDADGKLPVAGAHVAASEMVGKPVTDKSGAAFSRVFAAGDKPMVVWSGERFAIGGFGRLFDGIYERESARLAWKRESLRHAIRDTIRPDQAQLYGDRHVVAAYTDRPVYRPGQEVQFKLIVRELGPAALTGGETEFRAEDFSLSSQLSVPAIKTPVGYEVVNPRGRAVAGGPLELNDYGTAAGTFTLTSEEATGSYAIRVLMGDKSYIVPDTFAVKYYRRPNIEVEVLGVPESVKPRDVLKLQASARYYFGKAVAAGRMEARVVRRSDHQLVAEASAEIADGVATVDLALPDFPAGSQFLVITTVADESGRAVSRTLPCKGPAAGVKAPTLSELSRFVAAGETFKVTSDATELVARQAPRDGAKKPEEQRFKTEDGIATVCLKAAGWYTLVSGNEAFDLFVYGDGVDTPALTRQEQDQPGNSPRWVNLGDYAAEEDQVWAQRQAGDLHVLFDRQSVRAGDRLRMLVYAPFRRARLLFTIEGRTVSDYVVTWSQSAGAFHVVELPIKSRHAPNFYLQGRILAGEGEVARELPMERARQAAQKFREEEDGEDPRWCRIDVIDTTPGGEADKLKLSVKPDRREYRPGEKVNVTIQVTDLAGNPKEAEVSLTAVDESVYVFGEDRSGQIAQYFEGCRGAERYYRKTWRCSIGERSAPLMEMAQKQLKMAAQAAAQMQASAGDLARQADRLQDLQKSRAVMPSTPLALLGQMPAGTVPLGYLRSDFRETAAWQPQLRAGPDGKISTSFQLPDSLTAWRLTAVGLTRQTKIGRARAELKTRLPLAVQVFLPRFAVEKDRLQFRALVHNDGDAPRTCQALWKIAGARVESWAEPAVGNSVVPDGDAVSCSASIEVPAHGTARAAIWVRVESSGVLNVAFTAAEGADSDGELRQIPVQALGRAREVALSGTFENETTLNLPAGFVAEDLRISLARGSAAQGLSGIGYLVDYPYGCVEQTMSRFLPAVMVAHASKKAPVDLPLDVQKKLPEVLSTGLARLYTFQHDDGGWGWWEKDQTSNQMTVYVLYGLARCAGTGTRIDSACISRACEYLLQQLRRGELVRNPGPFLHDGSGDMTADLESAAWLALALAGKAPADELKRYAEQSLTREQSQSFRCHLALASRSAGLAELGEKFRQPTQVWQPKTTMELALKLRSEMAFGAPLTVCNSLADALLARCSENRWESTRATSAAIEALSELLAKVEAGEMAQSYRIEARGNEILNVSDRDGLKKMFHGCRAGSEQIRGEGLPLKLTAKCPEPVHYSINASGTQRQNEVGPMGTEVRLLRTYSKLDGTPVSGPLAAGEFVEVRLNVILTKPQAYLIVEDRLPAGWEFAHDQLSGVSARLAANVEFRDDRVCAFFAELAAGPHELIYYLRAETPGTVTVLPGCAYPMYSEKLRGETGSSSVEVK